jgi:hypothetical protein
MWPAIIAGVTGVASAAASRPKDPKEKRPIKTVIAIGIGAGVAYGMYKIIQKELAEAIQKKKNKKMFDEEIDPKIKASYKPTQFVTWADKLEDSFNSNFLDQTDEAAIYSIMRKLKNNTDWLELNKAYGLRSYYDPFSLTYLTGKEINLVKALQMELDSKEKNTVNYILKTKGITYRV